MYCMHFFWINVKKNCWSRHMYFCKGITETTATIRYLLVNISDMLQYINKITLGRIIFKLTLAEHIYQALHSPMVSYKIDWKAQTKSENKYKQLLRVPEVGEGGSQPLEKVMIPHSTVKHQKPVSGLEHLINSHKSKDIQKANCKTIWFLSTTSHFQFRFHKDIWYGMDLKLSDKHYSQ